ncbi:MAG TPA: SPFH domain-containing protein [Patescibacteria group bacterium]|nr:SPFH domain-containing protein [Patescibacteria group bacterium]
MEFDRLVVSFLVDEVVGGFFISVPPGHVACVFDRGRGVLPHVWGPGLHVKLPFWQIAKLFNAQILEYTIRRGFVLDSMNKEALGDEPILTVSKDGHELEIEASVLFRIDRKNAPELWENIGENVVSKVVRPIARSRISAVFASLTTQEIKANRTSIEEALKEEVNSYFHDKGLNCEGVLLSEVRVKQGEHIEKPLIAAETVVAPQISH